MYKTTIRQETWRCMHYHTGLAHPQCWFKYLEKGTGRQGYLDIEASNLDADWGVMISWCIKERDGKVYGDYLKKEDIYNNTYDKRITSSLTAMMSKFDIIYTYYGAGFDVPYVRSRAMKHNVFFPVQDSMRHVDLYYIARNKLKLKRNSLENVTKFLDIEGKNHIDMSKWIRALRGDKTSIRYIYDHNRRDVVILEELHRRLERYMKITRRSI